VIEADMVKNDICKSLTDQEE